MVFGDNGLIAYTNAVLTLMVTTDTVPETGGDDVIGSGAAEDPHPGKEPRVPGWSDDGQQQRRDEQPGHDEPGDRARLVTALRSAEQHGDEHGDDRRRDPDDRLGV